MVPGDRLFVVFLEQLAAGHTFTAWPLHITIVPWFRTAVPTADIAAELRRRFAAIQPFEMTAGQPAYFGYRGRKEVTLIGPSPALTGLEEMARGYLHSIKAWLADETTARRRQFRPHVTVQGHMRVNPGQTVICREVAITEQHGAHKEVAAVIPVGG
jgi:2'-5' RNA ligase